MRATFQWSWASKPMPQPWFSLFMALAGFILLSICAYTALEAHAFATAAIRTPGTVTDVPQSNQCSRPVISFVDVQGGERSFRTKVCSSPPAFSVGEKVVVLYRENAPAEARVESLGEQWFTCLITGIIGSALVLGSALAWAYRRRLFSQYAQAKLRRWSGS